MNAHLVAGAGVACLIAVATCATVGAIPNSVVVMCREGAITLPVGVNACTYAEAEVIPTRLDEAFAAFAPDSIFALCGECTADDTLGVARTGEVVRLTDWRQLFIVRFPTGTDIAAVTSSLIQDSCVVFAEPAVGALADTPIIPNDPGFHSGLQWNLGSDYLDASSAWEETVGNTGTVLAILDGGFASTHPDFAGRKFGDAGEAPAGDQFFAHGYMVAGVAGATGNNGRAIAGIDWNAQLLSKRIDQKTDDALSTVVREAVAAGADVLNMSWHTGTIQNPTSYSMPLRLALRDAYMQNVIAVAAMGNLHVSGEDRRVVVYPAGYGQGIIAVGATDRLGNSLQGTRIGPHIDVCAPVSSPVK